MCSFVTGFAAHRSGCGCMPMMLAGLRRALHCCHCAHCVSSVCCAGRSGAPQTAELRRTRAPDEYGTECAHRCCAVDKPRPRMYRHTATATRHAPWSPQREHAQDRDSGRHRYCGGGLQRLEMFIAVMLGARAALACRYRGRWLHGARCGAGRASVADARKDCGRGGRARDLLTRERPKALAILDMRTAAVPVTGTEPHRHY